MDARSVLGGALGSVLAPVLASDPDRILALAPLDPACDRPSARAARTGDRKDVVRALAEEVDELQLRDRPWLAAYEQAATAYLSEVARLPSNALTLPAGHRALLEIAERLLPIAPAQRDEVGGS